MTQHRTAARRVVVSLSCFAYHKMLRLLPKSKVGGIPGPEAYHKKYAQRRRLGRNSLSNEDSRLKRLYQPKQSSLFFIFNLQTLLAFFFASKIKKVKKLKRSRYTVFWMRKKLRYKGLYCSAIRRKG